MPRRGYTLFEMIVVLAIIVILAALVTPLMESMFSPGKTISATDTIREALAEMRARAMAEGRAYRFSIKVNGGDYRIEPDDPEDITVDEQTDPDKAPWMEGKLPDTVYFVTDAGALANAVAAPTPGTEWEAQAVILPDGTAEDEATIMFSQLQQQALVLHVRQLTGSLNRDETSGSTTPAVPD